MFFPYGRRNNSPIPRFPFQASSLRVLQSITACLSLFRKLDRTPCLLGFDMTVTGILLEGQPPTPCEKGGGPCRTPPLFCSLTTMPKNVTTAFIAHERLRQTTLWFKRQQTSLVLLSLATASRDCVILELDLPNMSGFEVLPKFVLCVPA